MVGKLWWGSEQKCRKDVINVGWDRQAGGGRGEERFHGDACMPLYTGRGKQGMPTRVNVQVNWSEVAKWGGKEGMLTRVNDQLNWSEPKWDSSSFTTIKQKVSTGGVAFSKWNGGEGEKGVLREVFRQHSIYRWCVIVRAKEVHEGHRMVVGEEKGGGRRRRRRRNKS